MFFQPLYTRSSWLRAKHSTPAIVLPRKIVSLSTDTEPHLSMLVLTRADAYYPKHLRSLLLASSRGSTTKAHSSHHERFKSADSTALNACMTRIKVMSERCKLTSPRWWRRSRSYLSCSTTDFDVNVNLKLGLSPGTQDNATAFHVVEAANLRQ